MVDDTLIIFVLRNLCPSGCGTHEGEGGVRGKGIARAIRIGFAARPI